jgi:hypothetical protein
MNRLALALAALLTVSAPALAQQHSHGSKGPNGGVLEDVAGVHAELLASGNTITVNILDESNKPMKTAGFTGSALVVNGSNRETVQLAVSGDNALKGQTKQPIAPSSQVTLMLKTAAGKSGQARFTLPKQ